MSELFSTIKIDKSGKELKDACKARLNKSEFTNDLSTDTKIRLDIMARHLTDKARYQITLVEAQFLGI